MDIKDRDQIAEICEQVVLDTACRLYGTSGDSLSKFDDYEGCANLVYQYQRQGQPLVLRISYRPDRSVELIQAELHFVNYLADNGVRLSRPVPSQNGNLIEVIPAAGIPFIAVSFVKGRGMRMPDNDYRYREGVPMQEYFQNWGQVLGQMHHLSKTYQPLNESVRRPEWHAWEYYRGFPYGEQLPSIQKKYDQLIAELHALPRDVDSYGLIHNDFNDGNFTVDYDNGDITVFDFDDSCYFWFIYDLACAWEGGIGWVMYRPLAERRAFMDRYMEQVLTGYTRHNTLNDAWLARLPLFLRLIQMQELMHYAQYLDEPDEQLQARLRYKIRCIEQGIPFMGFFDTIFNPQRPFAAR
ncbi:MAG: phosphotransferase [Anaerolineales bacterium]|nr:phosphotransferase [Anaerolineales bacterium]